MRMVNQAALQRTDREDPGMIPELLEIFCDSLPDMLTSFDLAVETSEPEAIRDAAHLMKSRLRYLHCDGLGDLAAEIEKQSLSGNVGGIDSKYSQLKTGIETAVEELRQHVGSSAS